jgi:deoxyribodipyrimidine photo-lyase
MIVFVHRKDLRTTDLPAFDYIRDQQQPSLHLLILDPSLLKKERHLAHSGIHFLQTAANLAATYATQQRKLYIVYGEPTDVLRALHAQQPFEQLVFHQDYTPYALHRDRAIHTWAQSARVDLRIFADQPLTDASELNQFASRTESYKVYTPYWNKWRDFMRQAAPAPFRATLQDLQTVAAPSAWLQQFKPQVDLPDPIQFDAHQLVRTFIEQRLDQYGVARDDFSQANTSGISRYLNLGVISARQIWAMLPPTAAAETWRRQLAWRDFYLYQAMSDPQFFVYDKQYESDLLSTTHFAAWANGETGIPIIDAAMRELNATGYMHNRLRMVTAMFLTKNLLCPFQHGETYFRYQLADYDNILNRGGWLWSSSLGFDAAPYFRIMSPVLQSQRFHPSGDYIRKWVPELAHLSNKAIHLPQPNAIVDLKTSREKAIQVYAEILKK